MEAISPKKRLNSEQIMTNEKAQAIGRVELIHSGVSHLSEQLSFFKFQFQTRNKSLAGLINEQ